MTLRQRILSCLQQHPHGIDDAELSRILGFSTLQDTSLLCTKLEKQGLVTRRPVQGKIRTFWAGETVSARTPASLSRPHSRSARPKQNCWFWEGNIQSSMVRYLVLHGYRIRSVADTAGRQQGIDIVAEKGCRALWVTVKGYPRATERTHPSVQAAHWFKQAVFDIVDYRGRDQTVSLAAAFPDFVRYHSLAERVAWLKTAARFTYYWIGRSDDVLVE